MDGQTDREERGHGSYRCVLWMNCVPEACDGRTSLVLAWRVLCCVGPFTSHHMQDLPIRLCGAEALT